MYKTQASVTPLPFETSKVSFLDFFVLKKQRNQGIETRFLKLQPLKSVVHCPTQVSVKFKNKSALLQPTVVLKRPILPLNTELIR